MTNFVLCIHVQIRFASTEKNYSHRLACILLPLKAAVFIDLSKAFDTLSYDILVLLYNLKYYGVTGTEFNLMQNCVPI